MLVRARSIAIVIAPTHTPSCGGVSDRLTIYDSRSPDTSAVVDVLCQARYRKKIASTGAQLLIEFESSSNRSSNGFSAKYRFVETFPGTYKCMSLYVCV